MTRLKVDMDQYWGVPDISGPILRRHWRMSALLVDTLLKNVDAIFSPWVILLMDDLRNDGDE